MDSLQSLLTTTRKVLVNTARSNQTYVKDKLSLLAEATCSAQAGLAHHDDIYIDSIGSDGWQPMWPRHAHDCSAIGRYVKQGGYSLPWLKFAFRSFILLLLARPMGQCCFARWRLSPVGVLCRCL